MKCGNPQQHPGGVASVRRRPAFSSTCGGNDGCATSPGRAFPSEPECPHRLGTGQQSSWEKSSCWTVATDRQSYLVQSIPERSRYFSFQEGAVGSPAATNRPRLEVARRKRE